jgi:hypothetical protein
MGVCIMCGMGVHASLYRWSVVVVEFIAASSLTYGVTFTYADQALLSHPILLIPFLHEIHCLYILLTISNPPVSHF